MKSRCPTRGGLQRKQPCAQQGATPLHQTNHKAAKTTSSGIRWLILTRISHHSHQQAMHVVHHLLPYRCGSNQTDEGPSRQQGSRVPPERNNCREHLASMVCPDGVAAKRPFPARGPHHGKEYGGRARRGAALDSARNLSGAPPRSDLHHEAKVPDVRRAAEEAAVRPARGQNAHTNPNHATQGQRQVLASDG